MCGITVASLLREGSLAPELHAGRLMHIIQVSLVMQMAKNRTCRCIRLLGSAWVTFSDVREAHGPTSLPKPLMLAGLVTVAGRDCIMLLACLLARLCVDWFP